MANGEGTQDFVEDIPAGKSVDKSGRAQQGNADSQEQPKQGAKSDLKICLTPTANCSCIISINASTLLLFFPTFHNWWFLSPDTTRQGVGASGCSTRKICSLLQMGLRAHTTGSFILCHERRCQWHR